MDDQTQFFNRHPVVVTSIPNLNEETCTNECFTALDGDVKTIRIRPNTPRHDLWILLNELKDSLLDLLMNELSSRKTLKYYFCVHIGFLRINYEGAEIEKEFTDGYRNSKCNTILMGDPVEDTEDDLLKSFEQLIALVRDFETAGSGWVINDVITIDLNIATFQALNGSQSTYVKLPPKFEKKKCLINVKNETDNKCFMWSILCILYPQKNNKSRVAPYKRHANKLNFGELTFPFKLKDVGKFEKLNESISINIFGLDDENENIYPLYVSKRRGDEFKCVDLLYVQSQNENNLEEVNGHYVAILSLNSLLHKSKCKNQLFFCRYCCHGFTIKENLESHISYCQNYGMQRTFMPKNTDAVLSYKAFEKEELAQYIIFADFESAVVPIHTCKLDPNKSYTIKTHQHTPIGYAYAIIGPKNKLYKTKSYVGENVIDHFLKAILDDTNKLLDKTKDVKPIIVDEKSKLLYKNSHCYLCKKKFQKSEKRVLDHCHVTGTVRGVCHNSCNMRRRKQRTISCYFHNLSKYDCHLIIKEMNKDHDISKVIAENLETIKSFTCGRVQFKDSLKILDSSINVLAKNLYNAGSDKFQSLITHFGLKKAELLMRKGVYPYGYVTSLDVLKEKSLPAIDKFYDDLTETHLEQADYDWASKIYKEFDIDNLGAYTELYCLTDVLILSDIFIYYRNLCYDHSGLDISHFVTTASYSWTACLKHTRAEIELVTDYHMYSLIESGLRGGVSSMFQSRHFAANNPLMKTYDSSKISSWIFYGDIVNLYGYVMSSFKFPVGDFKFLTDEEIKLLDIVNHDDNDEIGYILEVELETPTGLHDHFRGLCPTFEHLDIDHSILSNYTKNLYEECNIRIPPKSNKLTPTLNTKDHYVVHYIYLKYCLDLGLKVNKIYNVISFKQSQWVKEYIDMNTELRKQASNEFEKRYYKQLNNVIFGKSIESRRKIRNIQITTDNKKFKNLISKPNVSSWKIINKDLVIVEHTPTKITLNTPISTGQVILDNAKMHLLKYNEYFKNRYGDNMVLLFSDTDSLCMGIYTENLYNDLAEMKHLFDFSNFDPSHPLYDTSNRSVPGLIKDEVGGKVITHFTGLRAKLYCIKLEDSCIKKAKGVKKSVIERHLHYDNYEDALFNHKIYYHTMNSFRSYNQTLHSIVSNKRTISPICDKRYYLDSIKSLPYGHFRIFHLG